MYMERETGSKIMEDSDLFTTDEYGTPIYYGDTYYDFGDVLIHEDNLDAYLENYVKEATE